MQTFAVPNKSPVGRIFKERQPLLNSDFEEDRQRVIRSSAFKRLGAKMQVWPSAASDHIHRRLSHSLAVACIARTIAISLDVNVELAENIALAHDLGHPPFGHTGEDVLDAIMKAYGKRFYHNTHTFKIVTLTERKFKDILGLNLCFETLDGILKHNGPLKFENEEDKLKFEYIIDYINGLEEKYKFILSLHAGIEAQIAAIADDIAYLNHDIEDAIRHEAVTIEQLKVLPLFASILEEKAGDYSASEADRLVADVVSQVSDMFIRDAIATTKSNLLKQNIKTYQDITTAGQTIVTFSEDIKNVEAQLRTFAVQYIYPNKKRTEWLSKIEDVIVSSFEHAMKNPDLLPDFPWKKRYQNANMVDDKAVVICDFIAGMTDTFIFSYYENFTNIKLF